MARVAMFCARTRHVLLGAHPSYPDRRGFGRHTIELDVAVLAGVVAAQCGALGVIARAAGLQVRHVKPHGALYHDAARDGAIAEAVVRGAISALGDEITIIGPPTGALATAATARGIGYAREGFADRRMCADGSLVARGEPDALIADPQAAARQARLLASNVDTICVHGDTAGALAIARAVREALRA